MNSNAVTPDQTQSTLDAFFSNVSVNIDRLEKQKIKLDNLCDKINFSDYYKNQPRPVNECSDKQEPDGNDAKFKMDKLDQKLSNVEYKIEQAIDFLIQFIGS